MLALILSLITKVAIPEVMDYVRARQAATGTMPTNEEVQAAFLQTLSDGITKGTDWLSTHPAK